MFSRSEKVFWTKEEKPTLKEPKKENSEQKKERTGMEPGTFEKTGKKRKKKMKIPLSRNATQGFQALAMNEEFACIRRYFARSPNSHFFIFI